MFTLTKKSHCNAVVIDEILEDSSGRSFLIKSPDSRTFYFWCSEKSKLLGIELLGKVLYNFSHGPSLFGVFCFFYCKKFGQLFRHC